MKKLDEDDVWNSFSPGPGRHHECYEEDELLLEELSIFGWLRFYKAFDHALVADKHSGEFEIHYIVSGELNWWVRNTSYRLTAGTVLFIRPDELHGSNTGVLEPCEHYWLRISLPLNKALPGLTVAQTKALKKDFMSFETRDFMASNAVKEAFLRIVEEHRQPSDYSSLVCRASLHMLLTTIVRDYRSHNEKRGDGPPCISDAIQKTVCSIHDHLEEPLLVEELAQIACMSETSFRKRFRKEIGCSPHDYMIYRRMQKAKKLLLRSDQSIINIAFSLGFSSSQYFATVFKRKTGLSPKAFRDQGNRQLK
jgi:AraC-like DNA-binding protein